MPEYEDMDAPLGTQNEGEPVVQEEVTPEATETPVETPEATPEANDEAEAEKILAEEEAAHKPKTGSARLKAQRDEARARAERLEAELNQFRAAQQPNQAPPPAAVGIPSSEQFFAAYPNATWDQFEAFKSAEIVRQAKEEAKRELLAQEQQRKWEEGVRKAKQEIPDLDEHEDIQALIDAGVNLQATSIPAAILRMGAEVGPKVLHHLAKNTAEARRIAGLPPIDAAVELGALKAALVSKPTPKPTPKPSSAPPPLPPVRPSSGAKTRSYGGNLEDF